MISETGNPLAGVLGQRLTRLSRAVYPQPYQDPEHYGLLEFRFQNDSYLVLDIAPDGQSVCFRLDAIVFADPDGCIAFERLAVDVPDLIGRSISRIDALLEPVLDHQYVAAWRIWFDERYICYANYGDDARFLVDEIPPSPDGSRKTICG